jgi:hypothetical protein
MKVTYKTEKLNYCKESRCVPCMIRHVKTNKRYEINIFSILDMTVLIRTNEENVYYCWE